MAQRDLTKDDRLMWIDPVPVPGSGAYSKVICLTSVGGNRTTNVNTVQTLCGTKKSLGQPDITFDVAGTSVIDPDGVSPDAQMSIADLIKLWKQGARVRCKYGAVAPSEGDIIETFEASFQNVNDTSTAEANPTFTATLTVYMESYDIEDAPTT